MNKKVLCCLVSLYTIFFSFSTIYAENNSGIRNETEIDEIFTQKHTDDTDDTEDNFSEGLSTWPSITSETAMVMEVKSGAILYDKSSTEKKYPASMTKVMTALLLVEYIENNGNNLDERVKMSHEAVFGIAPDSSKIYMDVDETLRLEDALYAILLKSANEVSVAVAEHIAGTEAEFAVLMTKRAKEIGAKNTNFVNAHGLHDEAHYTTAYDMALIMKAAISHDLFVTAIKTVEHTIEPTEKYLEERFLINSNRLIQKDHSLYNPSCVGSKTGYTDKAQHTLVSYLKEDGKELIAVVMNGEGEGKFLDTNHLSTYAFSQFKPYTLLGKQPYKAYIPVYQAGAFMGQLLVESTDTMEVFLAEAPDLETVMFLSDLPAYVEEIFPVGTIMGRVEAIMGNTYIGRGDLETVAYIPLTLSQYDAYGAPEGQGGIQAAFSQGEAGNFTGENLRMNYPKAPKTQLEKDAKFIQRFILMGIVGLLAVVFGIITRLQYLRKQKKKSFKRSMKQKPPHRERQAWQ